MRDSSNIRVLQGSVKEIDQVRKQARYLARGRTEDETVEYDYFVAAAGLRRAWPAVPQSLGRKQWLLEAGTHITEGQRGRYGVVVVGGGEYCWPFCLKNLC